MRLKLPFEDVKKLYRFIDKDGTGEIGYDEFTMLTEEKWRGIDPFEHMQQNIKKVEQRASSFDKRSNKNDDLDSLDEMPNEIDRLVKLEQLAVNQVKIPIHNKKAF